MVAMVELVDGFVEETGMEEPMHPVEQSVFNEIEDGQLEEKLRPKRSEMIA